MHAHSSVRLLVCVLHTFSSASSTRALRSTPLTQASARAAHVDGVLPNDAAWLHALARHMLALARSVCATQTLSSIPLRPRPSQGMLPPIFGAVHPRLRTPVFTSVLTGCIAAVIAGLLPIDVLGEMVSIGTLFAFIVVNAGVVVLRRRQPGLHRPFRAPWVPWVPAAGCLVALVQMAALPAGTWWRFLGWLTAGLAVYFGYSRHHARSSGARGELMRAVRGGGGGGAGDRGGSGGAGWCFRGYSELLSGTGSDGDSSVHGSAVGGGNGGGALTSYGTGGGAGASASSAKGSDDVGAVGGAGAVFEWRIAGGAAAGDGGGGGGAQSSRGEDVGPAGVSGSQARVAFITGPHLSVAGADTAALSVTAPLLVGGRPASAAASYAALAGPVQVVRLPHGARPTAGLARSVSLPAPTGPLRGPRARGELPAEAPVTT